MVPNTDQQEWEDLLTKKEDLKLKSLSLQLKLASLKANIKIEKILLSDAIEELHAYCSRNEKLYSKDLKIIFENY